MCLWSKVFSRIWVFRAEHFRELLFENIYFEDNLFENCILRQIYANYILDWLMDQPDLIPDMKSCYLW